MGWNGSGGARSPQTPKVTAKKPSPVRGLIAGATAVAVVGGGLAWYCCSRNTVSRASNEPRKGGLIKEVSPAAGTVAARQGVTNNAALAKPPKVKVITFTTNSDYEVMKYIDGKPAWMFPHRISPYGVTTVKKNPARWDIVSRVFSDRATREIGAFAHAGPGEEVGPWLDFRGFTGRFLTSLKENPIEFSKDDTEEEAQLKRDVIELRKILKEEYDKGTDLDALLERERNAAAELGRYRAELEKQVNDAIKDHPEYTEKDVNDCIDAANLMLEEKGAGPIRGRVGIVRRFKHIQKKAAQGAQK